tara:strand:+ start:1368 stop:2210 length:843 start_codon:yes stop_codon:yes gene_type:complete
MIRRVYPIRLTRNSWNIPIYCNHICNNRCTNNLDNDNNYFECHRKNTIHIDKVKLSEYNQYQPYTLYGSLYNSDEIVIPNNNFTMIINFPLTRPAEVDVSSRMIRNHDGFNLRELIFCISETYKSIYNDEELTSDPVRYTYKKRCNRCSISDILSKVQHVNNSSIEKCCVCLDNTDKYVSKLECNHLFHTECLYNWIQKDNNTCPLCRKYIYNCSKCNGKIYKEYEAQNVVIPIEHRENPNRNTTTGIYGIYGYDYENLYLDQLFYDRIKKKLYIHIVTI